MLSKKGFFSILLSLLLVLTLILTACGSQTGGAADNSKSDKKVTITHYTLNSEDRAYIKDLMPEFEKTHPNIKMEFLTVPYENFDTKLQTLVASGSPPDVTSHYGDGGFIEYYTKDIITDLTPLMEASKFDPAEVGIPENLMNIYKMNGKYYGIPVSAYVSLLVYNKDMFDKAGVEYPPSDYEDKSWTFDKMVDMAKKLTKLSDNQAEVQYGLDWFWSEKDMKPLYFGAKVYSDDTWTNGGHPSECYFDSPEYIKATQRINDLIYVDKVSPTPAISEGLAGGESGDSFLAGKIAMTVTGAWEIYGIADLPFKVGVAAIPAGGNDKVRDVLYVDPLMVLKGSKNPEAAFEWIKYLVSEDVQVKSIELGGNPPANTKAFKKYFSAFPGIDAKDMENIVNGGIKYGAESYNHLIANYSQILDIVRNEQAPMDNENVPAADVQKIIQQKITEFIKK